jgi:hypothetical protein
MHQDLLAIPLHAQDRQHRDGADPAAQPHAEMKPIEVGVDEIQLGQGAGLPGRDLRLEPLDDPADGASGQRATLQQRPESPADPARVAAAEVDLQQRGIDLAHPAGVGREHLALPLGAPGRRRLQTRARHGTVT